MEDLPEVMESVVGYGYPQPRNIVLCFQFSDDVMDWFRPCSGETHTEVGRALGR